MLSSASRMNMQLLHPECGREPLFEVLKSNGFSWEGLNSNEETARAAIDALEESDSLPDFLTYMIKKRLEPYRGYLCFKLDWLLGRRLQILSSGQKCDAGTGVTSMNPGSLKGNNAGPARISDHLPIYADLDIA
jgi:hypothetical protein